MSKFFPLMLVVATGLTGLIYLIDLLVLQPQRRRALEQVGRVAAEQAPTEPAIVEYAKSFFPVLALVLLLRSFLFEPFQIPTGSMIPTLQVGDFILVNKYTYGIRLPITGTKVLNINKPKKGDVMVFIPPHQDEYFIKRVVGVPGDRVRYQDKKLYINGEEQPQTFVARIPPVNPAWLHYREKLGEVEHLIQRSPRKDSRVNERVIPVGYYFVMGDNRDRSSDSRDWGLVPEKNIVGKAVAIWLHKKPGLRLPEFSRNGRIE